VDEGCLRHHIDLCIPRSFHYLLSNCEQTAICLLDMLVFSRRLSI
jgi:hypothetical protein